MSQMKEQEKSRQKELNELKEMEASNLPDTKFTTMVIRMLNELRGRIYQLRENINIELVNKYIGTVQKNRQKFRIQ